MKCHREIRKLASKSGSTETSLGSIMSSMQNLSPKGKAQGHAEKTKVFPWRRHNTNISSFLLPTSGPNTKATQQMQRIRQTNPIPAKHRRNPPHPNPPPARVEADYQDYNTQKLAPIQKIPQVQIETHQDADKAAQQAIHTRINSPSIERRLSALSI